VGSTFNDVVKKHQPNCTYQDEKFEGAVSGGATRYPPEFIVHHQTEAEQTRNPKPSRSRTIPQALNQMDKESAAAYQGRQPHRWC